MPKPTDRSPASVELAVSNPAERDLSGSIGRIPYLPWVASALLGSGAAVLLGWVTVGVAVAAGWLTMTRLPPTTVLDTIAQLWLGLHGVPFTVAGLTVGLTPLGLTGLVAVAMAAVARYAAGQREDDGQARIRTAALVAGTCTITYSLLVLLLASLVAPPRQAASAFVGAVAVAGTGSLIGAIRACGVRLPIGLRAALRGTGVGLALLGLGAAVALLIAIVTHTAQIGALQSAVAPDAVGAVLLVVCYLAYAPTLLLWTAAYATGAGFTVGAGTLFTPWVAVGGLVPGLPIAGALPTVPPAQGWVLLLIAPIAGLAAGLAASRRLDRLEPGSSPAERTLVAALSGAGAAAGFLIASWLARGSLGTGRLVGLGPRFPELLVNGGLPIVAGAVVAGLAHAVWRRRRPTLIDDPQLDETAPFGLV
ncbi:DUF6350 family protein [Propioniciclava tarda]|uniref:Uncharacterized protein n=1 Tax=Propioniciclava tarda TaxID=433330 RepID=A0A4Q9KME7_PROTD|nr:DUF6350 family protein [Propioniciclava tarda]TBT95712.1 hypothetical protein ET996_04510 [Propioniciclava tarda]SMO45286.1 hypothetical protein SAMN06266982_10345 [Propioniciclava tarda]